MALAVRILQPFLSGHERRPGSRRRLVSPVGHRAGTAPHALSGLPGRSLQRTHAPVGSLVARLIADAAEEEEIRSGCGRTSPSDHSQASLRARDPCRPAPLQPRHATRVAPGLAQHTAAIEVRQEVGGHLVCPKGSLDHQTDADTGGRTGYYRPRIASAERSRGCSSMVEPQPSKLVVPVRSRSPAPMRLVS